MSDKKYQIFVSSTFADLQEERMEILGAITSLKHLAAGMEWFCASTDEQFNYIKRVIDDSDYYILVIKSRYGSIHPITGLSYTEMEFDYAVEKEIPILAFINENSVDKANIDEKKQLKKFIDKVQTNRMIKKWSDLSTLKSGAILALIEAFENNPRQGWQRFENKEDRAELLENLNNIRKEKDDLNKKYNDLLSKAENGHKIENLADLNDEFEIRYKYYSTHGNYHSGTIKTSWISIFKLLGPYIGTPIVSSNFSYDVKRHCLARLSTESVSDINEEDAQTIKYQFEALGLISCEVRKSSGGGMLEFIQLTDKGRSELLKAKTIKKTS